MSSTNQHKYESSNPLRKMWLRPFQRKFSAAVTDLQPTSLLELGAGEGFLLAELKKHLSATTMLGLDLIPEFVAEGKKLFPDLDLRTGDIYHIDQPDHSWDVVVASEVFEHLERPADALREVKRVARKNVVLSVPWEPYFQLGNLIRGGHLKTLGNHPEHINHWSTSSFAHFVGTEMTVEKVIRSMPWTIVVAKV